MENPWYPDRPQDTEFIYDFLEFTVYGLDGGQSAWIDILTPPGKIAQSYYKYGSTVAIPEHHWYEFAYNGQTGVVFDQDKITLHFTDGLDGDNDIRFNGIITDPGAPGFPPCTIDFDDLLGFCQQWLLTGSQLEADLAGGDNVNLEDFAIFALNWMNDCPTGWPWP